MSLKHLFTGLFQTRCLLGEGSPEDPNTFLLMATYLLIVFNCYFAWRYSNLIWFILYKNFQKLLPCFLDFPGLPKKCRKFYFFAYCVEKLLTKVIWDSPNVKIAQLTLEICFWKFILSFETWCYFLGSCLAYSSKEKRRAKKAQTFSKNELELIFVTLNQEQMNKKRTPINIRDFTK